MKKNKLRQDVFPVLAALIWGTAFVAQSMSTDFVGPFTFNTVRSVIAFVVLLIIALIFSKVAPPPAAKNPQERREGRKQLLLGGICCGFFLALASFLQQYGMSETSAGKAGFITALYVVLVPVFGIFLKKRASLPVWIGVALSVAGLYLLCIKDDFSIGSGDFFVFLCAIVFAMHILCIDHFVQRVDGIRLSCVQFLVVSVLSGLGMVAFETPVWENIVICLPQLLYVGIFSSGVAYTLQILSQKDSDPTVVTILLSLESVFSVLAGAIILGDRLTGREYAGCVLMFAAVLLAQIPFPLKKKQE
jgi:drug/metabolite transporter (DMT)-like permease